MNILSRIFHKAVVIIRVSYIKIFCRNIQVRGKISFRKYFTINVNQSGKLIIGRNVFFNNGCSLNVRHSLTIGDYCIFGENVKIYDHNHIFYKKDKPINNQGFSCKPVVIGSNCWIGSNTVVKRDNDLIMEEIIYKTED